MPTVIYSIVLAGIYFVLALICFKKRKSETASSSAINKNLQTVFRTLVSFSVCLIPIYMIIDELHDKTVVTADTVFWIGVLYLLAVITYFLYELISTKKPKNMLKAIPSIWGVLALNILFLICAHFGYTANYNYTPTPETISSVKFASNNIYYDDYFDKAIAQIDISDEKIEKLLCDSYKETREKYERSDYTSDHMLMIGFNTPTGYKYRRVMVTGETYAIIQEGLEATPEYKAIFDIDNILDSSVYKGFYPYYHMSGIGNSSEQ